MKNVLFSSTSNCLSEFYAYELHIIYKEAKKKVYKQKINVLLSFFYKNLHYCIASCNDWMHLLIIKIMITYILHILFITSISLLWISSKCPPCSFVILNWKKKKKKCIYIKKCDCILHPLRFLYLSCLLHLSHALSFSYNGKYFALN